MTIKERPQSLANSIEDDFIPSERERLLNATDFPKVELTTQQTECLNQTSYFHVITDHDKPELATVQQELMSKEFAITPHLELIYASNGDTSITPPANANIPFFEIPRPQLPRYLGTPDLMAAATQKIIDLISAEDLKKTWISYASADVWLLNYKKWLQYLADAIIQDKQLLTCFCGGLGLPGMIQLPDYYNDFSTIKNAFGATGLMTELFAIRADLANKTIKYWNRPEFPYDYSDFHNDPRVQPHIDKKKGLVEAHFRWMMACALGSDFENEIQLMHPSIPKKIFRPTLPRAYPIGLGYTSTHDNNVRYQNVEIAQRNGLDLSQYPKLEQWMNDFNAEYFG